MIQLEANLSASLEVKGIYRNSDSEKHSKGLNINLHTETNG